MVKLSEFSKLYEDFEQMEDFCSYDDYHVLPDGVAFKNQKNGKIYCFQQVDVERGRGDPFICLRDECRYYIFVDPNQTKLDEFIKVKKI